MVNKDVYIFIGPPGSGKGSLSSLCVRELGWEQLSTGNLCRKYSVEQAKIDKQIDLALKSGKLVSDSLISDMVDAWLAERLDIPRSVILDGYPRTIVQAQAFNMLLRKKFISCKLSVVSLFIADDKVINRLCSRYICQNKECQEVYSVMPGVPLAPKQAMVCDACSGQLGRRKDDELQAVRERLNIYHKHEQELLDFYTAIDQLVIKLDVDQPLHDVFESFKKLVLDNK